MCSVSHPNQTLCLSSPEGDWKLWILCYTIPSLSLLIFLIFLNKTQNYFVYFSTSYEWYRVVCLSAACFSSLILCAISHVANVTDPSSWSAIVLLSSTTLCEHTSSLCSFPFRRAYVLYHKQKSAAINVLTHTRQLPVWCPVMELSGYKAHTSLLYWKMQNRSPVFWICISHTLRNSAGENAIYSFLYLVFSFCKYFFHDSFIKK